MSYLSIVFLVYVICVLLLYRSVAIEKRWYVLLIASIVFYLCFGIRHIFFLLFVAMSTYFCALYMKQCSRKKMLLAICIGMNVAEWFVVKSMPWWLGNVNRVLNIVDLQMNIPVLSLVAPIGISYYTLQAIGYLIDVYRNPKSEPETNFGKYLLFLTYFPAIVQGPISRYEQLSSQLTAGKKVSYDTCRNKTLLVLLGITKKVVVADALALFVNSCFSSYKELSGIILYIGAVSYAIQLYMDFSGCVDICRGVSGLFGVELVDNFSAPYFSKSIKEFWRRWHISLSLWLKDYVYIPIGGSRKGKFRKKLNLVITFLISGIWHGAGFNYWAWGLLQAIYQIIGEYTYSFRKKIKMSLKVEENSWSEKVYSIVSTFNLTVFAWIFFRSSSFMDAIEYIQRMFGPMRWWEVFDGSLFKYGINYQQAVGICVNIILISVLDYLKSRNEIEKVKNAILSLHVVLRYGVYVVAICNIFFLGTWGRGYDVSGFLYGGF